MTNDAIILGIKERIAQIESLRPPDVVGSGCNGYYLFITIELWKLLQPELEFLRRVLKELEKS